MGNPFAKPKAPPPPAAPVVMPEPDDEELKKARKRNMAEQMSRSGRLSTILSESDNLGG